jgi:hypothetical protein
MEALDLTHASGAGMVGIGDLLKACAAYRPRALASKTRMRPAHRSNRNARVVALASQCQIECQSLRSAINADTLSNRVTFPC